MHLHLTIKKPLNSGADLIIYSQQDFIEYDKESQKLGKNDVVNKIFT